MDTSRAVRALAGVLPAGVALVDRDGETVALNGAPLRLVWLGDGRLGEVRRLIGLGKRPQVAVARRMSPGARAALSDAGIGWVDESGAAEFAVGTIIVSRTGVPDRVERRLPGWTVSALAVAEAVLCGTRPTTAAVEAVTGLSTGSCVNALRALADLGLLEAPVTRGRHSARTVGDPDRLLHEYSSTALRLAPTLRVQVGVVWRDAIDGITDIASRLASAGIAYSVTGVVASALLAPILTNTTTAELYVAGTTVVDLEAIAGAIGLRPVAGGRLTMRPFPTVTTDRLASGVGGLRVAPWPRVYADLLTAGVRGEDAAERLKETVRGR